MLVDLGGENYLESRMWYTSISLALRKLRLKQWCFCGLGSFSGNRHISAEMSGVDILYRWENWSTMWIMPRRLTLQIYQNPNTSFLSTDIILVWVHQQLWPGKPPPSLPSLLTPPSLPLQHFPSTVHLTRQKDLSQTEYRSILLCV